MPGEGGIHPISSQRLLHVLNMPGSIFDQPLALPQIGTHGRHARLRTETPPQQPVAVQTLQSCSVADVGFATWYILGISRIDQDHLKAVSFKHFIGRNPVNTGRFHRVK
jgi:hypothetical protein